LPPPWWHFYISSPRLPFPSKAGKLRGKQRQAGEGTMTEQDVAGTIGTLGAGWLALVLVAEQ